MSRVCVYRKQVREVDWVNGASYKNERMCIARAITRVHSITPRRKLLQAAMIFRQFSHPAAAHVEQEAHMSCACVHAPPTHHVITHRLGSHRHSSTLWQTICSRRIGYWFLYHTKRRTNLHTKTHHSPRTRMHGYGDSVHAGLRAAHSLPCRACALLSRAGWAGSTLPGCPHTGVPTRPCPPQCTLLL